MERYKTNKRILVLAVILVIAAVVFFWNQLGTDLGLSHFSKTHNENISKVEQEKVNTSETSPQVEQKDIVKDVAENSMEKVTSEGAEAELVEDILREVIPYTEPLPEAPSKIENNATLYGVDSNYNGVRDDLEILTVKEFGYDRDIVEAVFAGLRSNDMDLYYAKNDSVVENRQEILDNGMFKVRCYARYTDTGYSLDKDWYKIENTSYNNPERESLHKKVNEEVYGATGVTVTDEICNAYYERTKSWNIRQIEEEV